MTNIKEFMQKFLTDSGASEEALNDFNELYDNQIAETMEKQAQGNLYQSREEQSQRQQVIADAAAKHNVRGAGVSTGGSIADMAAKHNVRNR